MSIAGERLLFFDPSLKSRTWQTPATALDSLREIRDESAGSPADGRSSSGSFAGLEQPPSSLHPSLPAVRSRMDAARLLTRSRHWRVPADQATHERRAKRHPLLVETKWTYA